MPNTYGATWSPQQTTFRVWSPGAESIDLCLFDLGDHQIETGRLALVQDGNDWSVAAPNLPAGTPYGYRVSGPYDPGEGLRFNPAKLLVDPWARSIRGEITWADALFGYPPGDPDAATPDSSDNADLVPRSIVVDQSFDWQGVAKPDVPLASSLIYEAHVKGLTKLHPEVPVEIRGTYAGACHPAVIAHLQSLGVTAIEFLPIHTHVDDGFLVNRGLVNYWGYSTLGFFSPDGRYAATRQPGMEVAEFKAMVREFHRAGIEVLLDVVYNHTAEANHQGPTLAFRGMHNAEFYRLVPENNAWYADMTGTGNTINLHHPDVTRFVADSLRYWVEVMGVDGFRFDLAPVVGRTDHDFDRHAPIFEAILDDPVLARAKMIAEPWDLGPGGYQVGEFPDNWSEWNDRYRDVVRSFWRSDDHRMQEMGFRLTGSADFYSSRSYGPCASINFIAAHDGVTTSDLIAYQHKRNYGNGDNNTDGHDHDLNQYIGPDGSTTDPDILRQRIVRARSLLATLLLSRGVPMLLGGDEFGRTQHGNNNAYCQDSPLSWLDWAIADDNMDILEFVRQCSALRLSEPSLRIERFPDDDLNEVDPWIWFAESGQRLTEDDWNDPERRSFGILIEAAGESQPAWLALLFNASGETRTFALPEGIAGEMHRIECVLSSDPDGHEDCAIPAGTVAVYRVAPA